MTNTQTADSSIFLSDGYVNIAKIYLYGMWQNQFMDYYRIEKPSLVDHFVDGYCNAVMQIEAVSGGTSPTLNVTYSCNVYPDAYLILERIDTLTYNDTLYSYDTATLTVYTKFVIDSSTPSSNVTTNITAYGCVGACYNSSDTTELFAWLHVTKCTVNWTISSVE